ncbi:MAG: pilus assembly protein PilM, partial [Myxococcales bacterium]|nr:pilus assembly protein PilM [Myxococcales bacterium]
MARRIIGLDLGTYALKGALIETGMRDFRLVRIAERRLPQTSSETALGSVVSTALQELMSDLGGAPDVVVTGLTGERVFSRKLTLPFSDRKKIDSVIGFELEGVLPTDIEGLVYDYQVQAATDDGVEIFAVSAEQSYVGAFLRMLSQANIDPKVVDYEPYSYLNLIGQLPQETDRAIAVLDIGHRKTDLCIVVNGEVVVARTISRGGHQITREIAKAFDVEEHEAEALKHQRGFLALDEQMPTDPNEKRLAEAIRRGIFPLVRDVHQTLATSRAATSKGVATLHICGGGARLGGLVDYFESALGVTVEPLRISALPFAKGADLALVEDAGAKALALGLGSASDKRCSFINFRRGPFSYAGDFQFIRDRLRWVAIVALIFVALFSVKALQKYLYLSSTATAQKKNLEELT